MHTSSLFCITFEVAVITVRTWVIVIVIIAVVKELAWWAVTSFKLEWCSLYAWSLVDVVVVGTESYLKCAGPSCETGCCFTGLLSGTGHCFAGLSFVTGRCFAGMSFGTGHCFARLSFGTERCFARLSFGSCKKLNVVIAGLLYGNKIVLLGFFGLWEACTPKTNALQLVKWKNTIHTRNTMSAFYLS